MTALATTNGNGTLANVPDDLSIGAMESALALNDFSRLTSADRVRWVGQVCKLVGLNPLTNPIVWMTFQGKLVPYANKGCAEQLRQIHKISITLGEPKHLAGCYIVTARGTMPDGRFDESTAALPLPDQARGDTMANAIMKCETKAKRRVTLSLCGLGFIPDVSELETMEGAAPLPVDEQGNTPESAADRAARLNAARKKVEVVVEQPAPEAKPDLAAKFRKWAGLSGEDEVAAKKQLAKVVTGNSKPTTEDLAKVEAVIDDAIAGNVSFPDYMAAATAPKADLF